MLYASVVSDASALGGKLMAAWWRAFVSLERGDVIHHSPRDEIGVPW